MDHGDILLIFFVVALGSLITSSFAYFYTQYLTPRIMPIPPTPPSSPPLPPFRPPAQPQRKKSFFGSLKLTWFLRRLWRFRRRDYDEEGDEEAVVHPPVFCIEDLEVPPPVYARSRRNPPSETEMRTLNEQLANLKRMRESRFEPFEKTLHRADLVNLNAWIKHLENLVKKKAAFDAARANKMKKAIKNNKNFKNAKGNKGNQNNNKTKSLKPGLKLKSGLPGR